jgi:hypothetical protein
MRDGCDGHDDVAVLGSAGDDDGAGPILGALPRARCETPSPRDNCSR